MQEDRTSQWQDAARQSPRSSHRAEVGDARLEVIRVHIDAMTMVIDRRLEGDGGETGADMMAMLGWACELCR